ncbi:MAG: hypothetical protein FWH20_03240 [Oscillospiraceae bacterium]|nr:hypothetical protein [Oscillospiraceae bacterium]
MLPIDKLAYLNDLIKEMDIQGGTNEERLFLAITAALNEMSDVLHCYNEALDGMTEVLAEVEEGVYELEEEVFGSSGEFGDMGFGEFDDFNNDDEIYDITCIGCNKTITVDYDALDNGSITCPGCGELIEFTIEFKED